MAMTNAYKIRGKFPDQERVYQLLGQLYKDPRDAINEFVSNSADEYILANIAHGVIRIRLVRSGRSPYVVVSDHGRGMSTTKLEQIAKSLAVSDKALDARTIGEKGIGIIGFQAVADRCDIVSRAQAQEDTWCLSLTAGSLDFPLELEKKRRRGIPGTDVYLYGITKENWRLFTRIRLRDYFKERRRAALLRGQYRLQIIEGKNAIWVQPDQYAGIPFHVMKKRTPYGAVEFNLYLGRSSAKRKKRIALVGKGGTTIVEDITTIPEFAHFPWTSDKVEGNITFAPLKPTSGRTAVVRDRNKFPAFLKAMKSVESALAEEINKVTSQLDQELEAKILTALRKAFSKVMREMAAADSPFKTPLPSPDGQIEPGTPTLESGEVPGGTTRKKTRRKKSGATLPAIDPQAPGQTRQRITKLPAFYYDDQLGRLRSRFDEGLGVIYVNDAHPDYVAVQADPNAKAHYLMTLVGKEYVLWTYPGVSADDISEELVGFVAKSNRHLPRI